MIVIDASAAVDWVLQTTAGQRIDRRIFSRNESLHAPHLIDVEVTHVVRRLLRERKISDRRADEAIQDFLDARILRYPHSIFVPWMWRHRSNFSAYDGAYVALTDNLSATLLTRDKRLASAASFVRVEVF